MEKCKMYVMALNFKDSISYFVTGNGEENVTE